MTEHGPQSCELQDAGQSQNTENSQDVDESHDELETHYLCDTVCGCETKPNKILPKDTKEDKDVNSQTKKTKKRKREIAKYPKLKKGKMEQLLDQYLKFDNIYDFETWVYKPEQLHFYSILPKFMKYIEKRNVVKGLEILHSKYLELNKDLDKFMFWIEHPAQKNVVNYLPEFKSKLAKPNTIW